MTIDREKLIQLLVAKTGYDRERVEDQLSELISRIHEAASEGKSFEIEGFGIFTLEDDELNFEPADELRTEINHKYAGMEPIELIGAYGESDEDRETEPEPEPETDVEIEVEPELDEEEIIAGTDAGAEDRIDRGAEIEPEEESAPETEQETGDKEVEEPAGEAAAESGEAEAKEDEIWGIDDASSLADEISKARTEKWKKEQQEAEQNEPEQRETVGESGASDEDIDEVLKSLQDEPTIGEEEAEDQEEQVEFDDLERMLAEEEQEAGKQAAEAEPAGEQTGRWEPGSELKSSKPEERMAKPELKAKRKPPQKKKDPIGTILTVFLILVIVGVGGWFAYDMGVFSGVTSLFSGGSEQVASTAQPQNQAPAPSQTQTPPQSQDQSRTARDQNVDAAGGPGQQQAPVTGQQQQQQSGQEAEPETGNAVATDTEDDGTDTGTGEPRYGLKGPVNPDANSGYTIVVYSLQNETRARRLQNDLSDEGYRALLTDAVVNGNEYWRVGLGQFATVNDAQAAARSLREPFRNNFFIRRIE